MPDARPISQKAAVSDRRRRVAELALRGMSGEQIAEIIGCKANKVYKDISFLRMEWRKAALENVTDIVARELADLATAEAELDALLSKEIDSDRWCRIYDRKIATKKRRSEMLGLDQPKEMRLDAASFIEFTGQITLAIARMISDPEQRKRIGIEIERLAGRYIDVEICDSGKIQHGG